MGKKIKTYKLPINKPLTIMVSSFFIGSLVLLIWLNQKNFSSYSPILFGVMGGLSPLLLQNNSRYQLVEDGIEQKHLLQKTKLIEYSRIYKIRQSKDMLPKSWLIGKELPYVLEVFYDKFDSIPVLVENIEDFEAALKEKLALHQLLDKVKFEAL